MPLAKSAEQPTATTKEPAPQSSTPSTSFTWEGIPIDIFRQFNADLGTLELKEISKIRDIYEWAKATSEEPTLGNIMQKISRIENQLGAPHLNDKRWDKVWMWVKTTKQIEDLEKRRDSLRSRWQI